MNLSRLIQQAASGKDIVIARGSKPVARLVPIGKVKGRRAAGSMKDKLIVGPRFFEPLPTEELKYWE